MEEGKEGGKGQESCEMLASGYFTHQLTVAMVTGTRLAQDQASQNSNMDGKGASEATPPVRGAIGS